MSLGETLANKRLWVAYCTKELRTHEVGETKGEEVEGEIKA